MSFIKQGSSQSSLYAYDIPDDVLSTLEIKDKTIIQQTPSEQQDQVSRDVATEKTDSSAKDTDSPTTLSCNTCGLIFSSHLDQRDHARSDLHRYNTKRKLKELLPIAEDEFEELIANFEDEESGSDFSSSSDGLEENHGERPRIEDSKLNALFQKQLSIAQTDEAKPFVQPTKSYRSGRSPFFWFRSPSFLKDHYLGIYRALFTNEEQHDPTALAEVVRWKQVKVDKTSKMSNVQDNTQIPAALRSGKYHFMCMIGGGHFAAMIVSVIPKTVKSSKGVIQKKANVIAHKSFHRYTTRRKQGGAQSTNDSAKGAAHSAGASIRRHNEAALVNEVRELLASWRDLIEGAELVFVRATGSSNSKTIFGPYDGQVLNRSDPRLRSFPFSTRRATQTELVRSFVELTRVKIIDPEEIDVDKEKEESIPTKSQKAAHANKARKQVSKKSSYDELMELHSSQLISLIRRSKASAVLSYLEKESLPTTFRLQSSEHNLHQKNLTLLHLAASHNSHVVITALLTKANADPTLPDINGTTAFEYCSGRQSREAFRIARDELGEAAWNWDAAKVPDPLKRKDVEEREAQAKREADEQEEKRRQSELHRLKMKDKEQQGNEKTASKRPGKVPVTSASFMSPEEKRQEEVRGMTPAAIARLEREKRARAAEERMKRLQQ